MALLKYFAVVLTVCVGVALGYSTGAPADACHDLIPQHPATAQSTPLPYTFILSKAAVRAGETIKVTVRGNGPSDKIAGFMLQARDGTLPIGTFKVIEPTKSQLLKCNYNADTITHVKIRGDITEVSFQWTAPTDFQGRVKFTGTVALNGGVFWSNIGSETVNIK